MGQCTIIKRGVSYYVELEVLRPDGSPDDLTGFGFRSQVRDAGGALIADLSDKVGLKEGTEHVVTVTIGHEATWALRGGTFEWDILTDRPTAAGVDEIIPTEPFIVETPKTRPA